MRRLFCWLLLLAVVLAACDGGERQADSASSTTTSTLATSTSGSPATPTTVPAEFAKGAYMEGLPATWVDSLRSERWLTAPALPTTKPVTGNCDSLDDPDWEADCQHVQSPAGEAIAVHEQQGMQDRVLIYVKRGAARWDLALRAADDNGKEFDAIVEAVDPMGDGNRKFLVKMRAVDQDHTDGIDTPLQVDLVEPSGMIVVHLDLFAGRSGKADVRAIPRQGLEVQDCPGDCVPTAPLRVRLIAYRDHAWRVVDER